MRERIFLLLLVLCHLVVTEEASAKEEKVDGEKDQGGGGNSVTMDHDKKGRMANKESEKSESETRGPPRLRKAMEVVVGRVGQEVKLVCPITGNPTPIIEWEKVGDQTLNM